MLRAVQLCALMIGWILPSLAAPASAFSPEILQSVIAVLPEWPGYPRGRAPAGVSAI